MIFDSKMLLDSPKESVLKSFDINESLFIRSLSLIEESDKEIRSLMKDLSLQENSVYESNEKWLIDIKEIARKIINFFITTMTNLYNRFKAMVMKFVYSDTYIERNQNLIRQFDDTLSVDFDRYLYSFNDSIPSCDLSNYFDREFDDIEEQLRTISKAKDQKDRMCSMDAIYKSIQKDIKNRYYDKVRGACIKKNPITADVFSEELFNVYRSGGKYYEKKVSAIEVTDCLDRFINIKSIVKEVEKEKQEIINNARKLEKRINSLNLKDYSSTYQPYILEEENSFSRIQKIKVGQISEVAKIFIMAFSAKLDALKESIVQDKKVLYEVLVYMEVHK